MTSKGVTYDAKGDVASCVFCDIASGKDWEESRDMWSDGVVAKFRSRAYDAEDHWLIVPVEHVSNINDPALSAATCDRMIEVAKQCGDVFCFHVPPANSIDHLHLHAFRGQFKWFKQFKHAPACYKFWTIDPHEVRSRLMERNGGLRSNL